MAFATELPPEESTVKAHVKQIIKRLRVANRTQAALLAAAAGPFPFTNAPPPRAAAAASGVTLAAR